MLNYSFRSLATVNQLATVNSKDACAVAGLVKRQQVICRRNVEVMASVMEGARMAIKECKHQFQNRRWNCSTVDEISMFGNVLNQGEE